ncbi:MAG: hypothetical protein NTV24_03825 [Candidatus Woesebacteria bacterium]|nr:hypothetical protein [Candidatus Woesebacteria bacterium]
MKKQVKERPLWLWLTFVMIPIIIDKMYRITVLDGVKFNLSSGVETSMEITLQGFFKGAKIIDIPTIWRGRTLEKSKFRIFHRAPKYAHIVYWSLENSLREFFGLNLKKFYVS